MPNVDLVAPSIDQGRIFSWAPGITVVHPNDLYRIRASWLGKSNQIYRLLAAYLYLHADAAGGNRYFHLRRYLSQEKTFNNAQIINQVKSDPIAAGAGGTFLASCCSDYNNCADESDFNCKLGSDWIISGFDYFEIEVSGSGAGDTMIYWLQLEHLNKRLQTQTSSGRSTRTIKTVRL